MKNYKCLVDCEQMAQKSLQSDKCEGEQFNGVGLLGWYSPTMSLLKFHFYGKLSWYHDNQVIFRENTATLAAICQRFVTGENDKHW